MQEALSDEFDVETLLDTDDALSYRRTGIGTDVTRKLRKGGWSIQGQVDLHGLRREDARQGPGFTRQNPSAQRQGAKLADSKARSTGLCASPARAWRCGSAGGGAGAELKCYLFSSCLRPNSLGYRHFLMLKIALEMI